ncbi:hypothetical protein GOP47_0022458 [Adiantum capillus-veneris]|uniref:CRAL-TRIO domain-containing protein n=1 Tax=Adiantum capillus-veneris TaxID=13818 RepID=A0A9D4U7F4_ADICA|nr:hypothetical protein GOP47_0022458 [Adiantum capillus-veneris]
MDVIESTKVEELRSELGALNEWEKLYCSDACLKRYLRARNGNVSKAKGMLRETLKWRQSYKPQDIKWEDVAVESETGKMYRADFTDRLGRPVIIMIPRNQNTTSHEGQLKQLVYTMEKATLYLPRDQEQFLWIIDFEGWSLSKASPLKTVRETAHILQNHYPERLAVGVMLNAPKIFEYTWKVWKPFIDPATYKKARFIYTSDRGSLKTVEDVFDLESIGFNFKDEYNHSEFAKLMQADDLKTKLFWEQAKGSEQTNGVTSEIRE